MLSALCGLLLVFFSLFIISTLTHYTTISNIRSTLYKEKLIEVPTAQALAASMEPFNSIYLKNNYNESFTTSQSLEESSKFVKRRDAIQANYSKPTPSPISHTQENISKTSFMNNTVNITKHLSTKQLNITESKTAYSSTFIRLFSWNLLTFLCFLFTLYFKALLSLYFCTLSSLERWNITYLSTMSIWRKLSISLTILVYFLFAITCGIAICVRFKKWAFLVLPFYILVTFLWLSFQLLNTINLSNLINKITDCYLMLNESNGCGLNSGENTILRRSRSSPMTYHHRHNRTSSTPSQASNSNSSKSDKQKGFCYKLGITKLLVRLLVQHRLKPSSTSGSGSYLNNITFNIPIHRILAHKGVRHLGSISYRISLYCFIQTCILAIFTFITRSPFTIGLYLITICLNFIWISLLYQFSKNNSGTCIAYAIVAPPLSLNYKKYFI